MTVDDDLEGGENADALDIFAVPAHDWFLKSLLKNMIGEGAEIGVTFTIGGAVISGIMISAEKYFEELGNTICASSTSQGDFTAVVGESIKGWTALFKRPDDAPEDWAPLPIGYVHLRNAQFFTPGQQPIPSSGTLWRGKLSSIDGFSLNSMTMD
jgi:hypothetical protein